MPRFSVVILERVSRQLEVTVEAATIKEAMRDALDGVYEDSTLIRELPVDQRTVFSIDTIEEDQ